MVLHSKISNNDFESNTELEVLEDQFLRCTVLVQDQKLSTPCCAKCYSMNIAFVLKGLWHEVIFRAKIVIWCLFPFAKSSCRVMKKLSDKFHQWALIIITWGDFDSHSIQNWKGLPSFSMSILATRWNRRPETVSLTSIFFLFFWP